MASIASAEPRVIVADPDEALRTAIADMLRPWLISVDDAAPKDHEAAITYAIEHDDRYVIWREPGALVVLDRTTNEQMRRTLADKPIGPIEAAAIALSIKTMLRLEPVVATPPPPPVIIKHPLPEPPILRLAVSSGARAEEGLDGNVALRFGASFSIRAIDAWWVFAQGDAGASATVDQAGFRGTWLHWSALVGASYGWQAGAWELAPSLAIGIQHSTLDGTEDQMARSETALLPELRAGFAARYHLDGFAIGPVIALEWLPTTDTYTKLAAPTKVFEIPPYGASLSLEISTAF
ncbi:MAG: hypothetical protein QM831_12025 [Kofleriaceae bacterium]